jgi:aminoglycoside phosphotransferase
VSGLAVEAGRAPQRVTLAREVGAIVGEPDLRALVLATSRDPNAKVTVLLFPPGGRRPAYALKMPTTGAAEVAVRRERRLLGELQELDLGPLRTSVPRPLSEVEVQGRCCLLTTAVPGASMFGAYHRWRHTAAPASVRADFRAAGAWLAAFQERTAGCSEPLDLGRDLAAALDRRFATGQEAADAIGELERVHAVLAGAEAPRTAVHGDFWTGNLLVTGDQVAGVVDWELGAISGEPARDLVRFALTYALYLDRHARPRGPVAGHPGLRADRWGAGIAYAMAAGGWFCDLFRGFLQDGLRRLGVAPELWRAAALAGLAEIAATADHGEFARRHFELFTLLSRAA